MVKNLDKYKKIRDVNLTINDPSEIISSIDKAHSSGKFSNKLLKSPPDAPSNLSKIS